MDKHDKQILLGHKYEPPGPIHEFQPSLLTEREQKIKDSIDLFKRRLREERGKWMKAETENEQLRQSLDKAHVLLDKYETMSGKQTP